MNVKRINFTSDFEAISRIWYACFPEDADFAEDFLRGAAHFAEGFALYEEDTPVSMAFFLPAAFHAASERFHAYYVYGVGTLPVYRGHGYAGTLLSEAQKTLRCDMLFLYPATPSLRAFYQRLGYRAVLSRDVVTENAVFAENTPSLETTDFCAYAYAKKRNQFLENKQDSYVTFDNDVLQVMLGHAKMLTFSQGMALCIVEDTAVYLPEVLCVEDVFPIVVAAVKARYPNKKITVYTAGDSEAAGMVLPCSKKAIDFFENKETVPFFGSFFAE